MPLTVLLGTNDGQLFRSTDGGQIWRRVRPGLRAPGFAVTFLHFDQTRAGTIFVGLKQVKDAKDDATALVFDMLITPSVGCNSGGARRGFFRQQLRHAIHRRRCHAREADEQHAQQQPAVPWVRGFPGDCYQPSDVRIFATACICRS